MLTCKEIAQLVSEGLDRELPWHERLQVRIHLFLCSACGLYEKQMNLLRSFAKRFREREEDVELGQEAKERIKRLLEKTQKE